MFISACVCMIIVPDDAKTVGLEKVKTFKERLKELGIILSPLTTNDESDDESAKIAAREREALWKSKPLLHDLLDISFGTRGCYLKRG